MHTRCLGRAAGGGFLTQVVRESQVHRRRITEAFLQPLFSFFLSFLPFVHSSLSSRTRPETRVFQQLCVVTVLALGSLLSRARRLHLGEENFGGPGETAGNSGQRGAVTGTDGSVHAGACGQKGHSLP